MSNCPHFGNAVKHVPIRKLINTSYVHELCAVFLQRHKLCIVFKCITKVKVTCKMVQIYTFIDGADKNVSPVRNKSESDLLTE